jgi:hypothetical protein
MQPDQISPRSAYGRDRVAAGPSRQRPSFDVLDVLEARQTRILNAGRGCEDSWIDSLYNAESFDDVLLRIAEAAVSTIAGCRMASVTLCERSGY